MTSPAEIVPLVCPLPPTVGTAGPLPRARDLAIARGCAALAAAIGTLVLFGWWLAVPALTSIVPGYVTMKPNTALGLVFGGAALWFFARRQTTAAEVPTARTRPGTWLAIGFAAIGVLTLLEYALDLQSQAFDRMLVLRHAGTTPLRIATTTALSFAALGAGLATTGLRGTRAGVTGEWLVAAGLSVPFAILVGYVYGVIPTRGVAQGLQMALHTAIGCVALGAGAFLARPDRPFMSRGRSRSAGGVLVRRLLPATIGLPIALGALRMAGERIGIVGPVSGNGAVAVATMLLVAAIVWRTAGDLDAAESARAAAEADRGLLQRDNARLAATLSATSDVVVITDAGGRISYLNSAGRRLLDLAAAGAPGGGTLLLAGCQPAWAATRTTEDGMAAALRDGTWSGETALTVAGGREVPVSHVIVAHRTTDDAQGTWFLSHVLRDISEQKEAGQRKSEFVATVSHEIRTPLTSIRGSLGLLEAGIAGALTPKALELTRIARANTERLVRLVTDVLDLEKMEAGHLHVHLAPVDVVSLLAEATAEMRGTADLAGVRFVVRPGSTRTITADRDRLLQVIGNLLSNALKYAPRGSEVILHATDRAGDVRVSVEDGGPGIPADRLPELFEKFRQLDGSDSRRHGGTGLGLAIARAIIAQHGGRMGVESVPGVRTTFWCEVPAAVAAAA